MGFLALNAIKASSPVQSPVKQMNNANITNSIQYQNTNGSANRKCILYLPSSKSILNPLKFIQIVAASKSCLYFTILSLPFFQIFEMLTHKSLILINSVSLN